MSAQDPFAKYGGSEIKEEADPFAKYGGKAEGAPAKPLVKLQPVTPPATYMDFQSPFARFLHPAAQAAKTLLPHLNVQNQPQLPDLLNLYTNPSAALETVKGLAASQGQQFTQAFQQGQSAQNPNAPGMIERGGHLLAGMTPLIGPMAAQMAEPAAQGDVAGVLGGAATMLAPEAMKIPPAVKKAIGDSAARLGMQIEKTALKPTGATLSNVRTAPGQLASDVLIENMFKNQLGGTFTRSIQKTNVALETLSEQLKTVLKSSDGTVDLNRALDTTEAYFKSPAVAARYANDMPEILKAIQRQRSAIETLNKARSATDGVADLYHSNLFKRSVGDEGAWFNGMVQPETKGRALVADQFYAQLRQNIENAASGSSQTVRDINARIGEIAPVQDALVRRIPVAQRNELIGIKEFIGAARGDALGFGLGLINRSLKSPAVADLLVRLSRRVTANPEIKLPSGIADMSVRDPISGELLMNAREPIRRMGDAIIYNGKIYMDTKLKPGVRGLLPETGMTKELPPVDIPAQPISELGAPATREIRTGRLLPETGEGRPFALPANLTESQLKFISDWVEQRMRSSVNPQKPQKLPSQADWRKGK